MKPLNILFVLLLTLFLGACSAPKPLEYKSVNHVNVSAIGLKHTKVSMDVVLYNPNKYALNIKSGKIDVYLNDVKVGTTDLSKPFSIPKLQTFEMPIALDINVANLLSNTLDVIRGNKKVKLIGNIKAGKRGIYIKMPVNYEVKD